MKSKNGNKFEYSSYWGTWSRILAPFDTVFHNGHCVGQVEVNVTPTNITSDYSWIRHNTVIIRAHGTSPSRGDELVEELPEGPMNWILNRVPDPKIQKLILHADLLPQIDWELYHKFNNGGASFFDIQKAAQR